MSKLLVCGALLLPGATDAAFVSLAPGARAVQQQQRIVTAPRMATEPTIDEKSLEVRARTFSTLQNCLQSIATPFGRQ